MKKEVDVRCENPTCGKTFKRYIGEYNRRKKLGKKQYCSMKCYALFDGKNNLKHISKEKKLENIDRIKKYSNNKRDELTPFRFFTHVIRNSRKSKKININESYLKKVWDKQNGICPFTGWNLILPDSTAGWKNGLKIYSASLDRIDNSKGYIEGNVRFVSCMANYAKNSFTDYEMNKFCQAIAKQYSSF